MPHHEPAPGSKRERSPLVIAVAIVVALPVLYVLSIGPVQWLARHGYINDESAARFIEWFYAPLAYASNVEAINNAIIWYLSFWD